MIDSILTVILISVIGIAVGIVAYIAYLVYNILKQDFAIDLDDNDV